KAFVSGPVGPLTCLRIGQELEVVVILPKVWCIAEAHGWVNDMTYCLYIAPLEEEHTVDARGEAGDHGVVCDAIESRNSVCYQQRVVAELIFPVELFKVPSFVIVEAWGNGKIAEQLVGCRNRNGVSNALPRIFHEQRKVFKSERCDAVALSVG